MENKLKKLRKELGISQEQFANDIGISVRTLQRYENQNYNSSIYCIAKICKYFNVSIEELLADTTNTTNENISDK